MKRKCETDLLGGLLALAEFLKIPDDAFLDDSILLLGPPVGDGDEISLSEVVLELLAGALVRGEEGEEVLDATLLEGAGEVVHRLVDEVRAEDEGDDGDGHSWRGRLLAKCKTGRARRTVLDQVVLGQTLEARCVGEALGDEEAGCEGELVLLGGRPAVDVLEETREGGFLEGLLKIFVSAE
jgi:hypothetical protein